MKISDRISSPAKRITSRLQSAVSKTWTATVGIKDRASAPLDVIRRGLGEIGKSTLSFSPAVEGIAVSTAGVDAAQVKLRKLDKAMDQARRRGEIMGRMRIDPTMELRDWVSAPVRRIASSLHSAAGKTWTATVAVKDLATGPLGMIRNSLGAISRAAFSLPSLLAGSAVAIGGIAAPLKLASDMEQANIAFTTMLGSASKANTFLSQIADFAIDTPFDFPGLRDSAKWMLAFDFSEERVLPMMTGIGNAAASLSLGSEGVDRITLALGQMQAKAKVSGDEMLQLTEAGIPAWDILAKKMNTSTAQVMKLSEKGLIPAGKAIDALVEGMNDRFPNMMDKQSKSLAGLWNSIKETFSTKILTRWGDGIAKGIKPQFDRLATWIENKQDTIERLGTRFSDVSFSAA